MRSHVLTHFLCKAYILYVHWPVFLNIFCSFLIFCPLNIWEAQKLTLFCHCFLHIHLQIQPHLPSSHCFSSPNTSFSFSLLGLTAPAILTSFSFLKWSGPLDLSFSYPECSVPLISILPVYQLFLIFAQIPLSQ